MARMIPTFFDDSTPPGERDVFGWLANGPADWVVLHQLDLAGFRDLFLDRYRQRRHDE